MSQTKVQLVEGLNINTAAPATALQIDSSGNINLDSNTLYVDATNNRVGLGTSTPGTGTSGNGNQLVIANAGSASSRGGLSFYNGNAGIGSIYFADTDSSTAGGIEYNHSANSMEFRVNDGVRAVIDSSGRVGIGTTTVDQKLHLRESGATSVYLRLDNNSAASQGFIGFPADGSYLNFETNKQIRWTSGSSFSERMRLDESGRLLIGTSSTDLSWFDNDSFIPQVQLKANSLDSSSISLTRTSGSGPVIWFQAGASGSNPVNGSFAGGLNFSGYDGTNYRNAARISSFIDTTPGSGSMPGRLVFYTTPSGSTTPQERMAINRNGSLTVPRVYNDTTANAANVWINTNGDFGRSTSSAKYKTNIESIDEPYSTALLDCRPVWYRSTCASDNPNWGWWGFIAEEVAAIDPRLVHWKTVEVTYDEKGAVVTEPCDPEPESVQYDRFVPHLLNLIKRQKEQIEAMEARLSALEAQ